MRRITFIVVALMVLFLLAGGTLAQSSTNYHVAWYTPLDSGGGGVVSSAHYNAQVTIGQTGIGALTSENFRVCSGFWCGLRDLYRVLLPIIQRTGS